MLQIGKVYKYQWATGDCEYLFLVGINSYRVYFYTLKTPDIIEYDDIRWANDLWVEV